MTDTLYSGQELQKNVPLVSQSNFFHFVFQDDGNLVLYEIISFRTGESVAIWQSNTDEEPTNKCILQDDGNLVIYGIGKVLWASKTNGNPGSILTVQNDGNVVIYNNSKVAIWATNTVR
jgi:hypothetical protein